MDQQKPEGLSAEELEAQGATALPDKEVVSILDLNADIDLAIDAAAPIDLAVAANANVAAPIDAAVGANILSEGSTAQAMADQGVMIDQGSTPTPRPTRPRTARSTKAVRPIPTPQQLAQLTPRGILRVLGASPTSQMCRPTRPEQWAAPSGRLTAICSTWTCNLDADADIAAPINGAVAANANVAAPIDAAVAANIGSVDSDAVSVAQQDAIINQDITGSAEANSDQASDIQQ